MPSLIARPTLLGLALVFGMASQAMAQAPAAPAPQAPASQVPATQSAPLSLVPENATPAISEEDLLRLQAEMEASSMGSLDMPQGPIQGFEEQDPALFKLIQDMGLAADPVLRQSSRLPENNSEAHLRDLGRLTTQSHLDVTRLSAINSRLALYSALMEFQGRIYEQNRAAKEAELALREMMASNQEEESKSTEQKSRQEPEESPAPVELAPPPPPRVSALYTYDGRHLAELLIGNHRLRVREGDILPTGEKVRSISNMEVELVPEEGKPLVLRPVPVL